MIKIITLSVIMLFHLTAVNSIYAQEPQIVGEAAVLIDAQSGQVLYEKNADKRMYPASTTKILTAIVALERGNLNDIITVSSNAARTEGSAIWVKNGEKMTLEDMLYALMLNSANDVAVAIAEHYAGTVEQFSLLLNETAKKLGAKNTHFTNPHGLPDKNHYTTARDLAVIARYAMQDDTFAKIVGTKTKTITREDPEDLKFLINHNRLLWKYDGAVGIKTGYTTEALQCIVAAASRDNRKLIAVVLKTRGTNIWTDTTKLLDYGFNNFKREKLISRGETIQKTAVKYTDEEVLLTAAQEVNYNFPVDHKPEIKHKLKLYKEPAAPLEKGEPLGELIIMDGSQRIASVKLLSASSVKRPLSTYWWFWALITLLVLIPLALVLRFIWFIKTGKIRLRRIR